MTRYDWVRALITALGVGMLPGCLSFSRPDTAEAKSSAGRKTKESVQVAAAPAPAAKTGGPNSPYGLMPTPPVHTVDDRVDAESPERPPEPAHEPDPPPVSQAVHYANESSGGTLLSQAPATGNASSEGSSLLAVPGSQVLQISPIPDPGPPLIAALRCLIEKRPGDAVSCLQDLDKANQEVLLCLLPLAARLGEGPLDRAAPGELTVMVDQADGIATPLRRRAPLVIDKMCFCRRIDKFGQYEPLPDAHQFRCGELVQVYAELRNFSNDAGKAGYETRLASSVRLTCEMPDHRTETIWRQDFHDRDRVDRSRSPRRDYFNNYRFCIPENIPRGTYKLWLTVIDVPTGRSTESSLLLAVAGRGGP